MARTSQCSGLSRTRGPDDEGSIHGWVVRGARRPRGGRARPAPAGRGRGLRAGDAPLQRPAGGDRAAAHRRAGAGQCPAHRTASSSSRPPRPSSSSPTGSPPWASSRRAWAMKSTTRSPSSSATSTTCSSSWCGDAGGAHAGGAPGAAGGARRCARGRRARAPHRAGTSGCSRTRTTWRRGPVDLVEVLRSAAKMAAHEIRDRARLVEAVEDVPPVQGNSARLCQVFLNLLINAAHAIAPGGWSERNPALRPGGRPQRVIVEVSDTGCGIPRGEPGAHLRARSSPPSRWAWAAGWGSRCARHHHRARRGHLRGERAGPGHHLPREPAGVRGLPEQHPEDLTSRAA